MNLAVSRSRLAPWHWEGQSLHPVGGCGEWGPICHPLPTSTATVQVNVEDRNDVPVFDPVEKVFSVSEHLPVDSDLVLYTAIDPDIMAHKLMWVHETFCYLQFIELSWGPGINMETDTLFWQVNSMIYKAFMIKYIDAYALRLQEALWMATF